MQRLRRFSRYWDLLSNSGNFRETLPLLWTTKGGQADSPFAHFLELSDSLYGKMGRNHGIALQDLAEFLFNHLQGRRDHSANDIAAALWRDYQRAGRSDRPVFLRSYIAEAPLLRPPARGKAPARQARHLA
jgi:hypothetical protein